MRNNKIATAVVLSILAMVVSAAACMVMSDRSSVDDSDGAVTYKFRLELNNSDGMTHDSAWLTATADSVSKEGFVTALRSVATTYGIEVDVSDTAWLTSFTIEGVNYHGSGEWGKEGCYAFGVYYPNGDSWGAVSTYTESSTIVIILNEVKFSDPSSDSSSSDYYRNGDGPDAYWVLLPKSASADSDTYAKNEA